MSTTTHPHAGTPTTAVDGRRRPAAGLEARPRRRRRRRDRHDPLAALASAAGVSFADRSGAGIPIAAFAAADPGLLARRRRLAAVMARKARRPRTTFVRTAIALTALSYVPDLTFGFDAASAVTLIALHSIAAAIVVPTLARRLARTR